jgi:deazaflavin-dependent oxidoreductase (nitroreductase family)
MVMANSVSHLEGTMNEAADTTASGRHYKAPGWFTRNVFNRTVAGLTKLGISVMGSRVLETKGRTSGQARQTPVNLLTIDGHQYLVSPRGEGQWVRNVRADEGRLTLLLGRNRQAYIGRELPTDDPQTATILRAYLQRWKAEVGVFFDGTGPDSSDAELTAIAPKHPIFELTHA